MDNYKEEMRTLHMVERNEILGIVLKALDNGGFSSYDKMVAICEVNDIIDNANYDELKEEYIKWLREARYEKNTFRKISKRVCNFFNKKRPE